MRLRQNAAACLRRCRAYPMFAFRSAGNFPFPAGRFYSASFLVGEDALHHRLRRLMAFLRYPACFHAGDHSVPQSVAKRGQKIPELPNRCGHAVRHGPFHLSDFRQTDENASAGPADDLQRCVAARGLHEGKRILIELVALCA